MAKLQLQLVTPERTVLAEELDSLTCQTTNGEITILPGHTPLIAPLVSGELIGRTGMSGTDGERNVHVAGGFVQVKESGEVIILADTAERFFEIDIERAEQAKAEAEQMLKEQTLSDEEYAFTMALIQKNTTRLHIARKHAHRNTRITSEGVLKE